jgi:hypothetical protein
MEGISTVSKTRATNQINPSVKITKKAIGELAKTPTCKARMANRQNTIRLDDIFGTFYSYHVFGILTTTIQRAGFFQKPVR